MSTIKKSDFQASLSRLENMAKGQLFHTASNSVPAEHAGTKTNDMQDSHEDGIDENGTDYNGVKKALAAKVEKSQALTPAEVAIVKGKDPRKLIAEKVAKGQALTAAESWAIKSWDRVTKSSEMPQETPDEPGESDDAQAAPATHAAAEEKEVEEDAKKALDTAVANSQSLRKGIEMSPVLAEFARAMGFALKGVEANVAKSVVAALAPVAAKIASLEDNFNKSQADQGEFNRGFAETLVGIGKHISGQADQDLAQASLPAGAPKSQLRAVQGGQGVQAVSKSFGPGGLPNGGQDLAKAQIVDALTDLVKSNKLNSLEVIKYETSGQISPQVHQMVLSHLQGQGRN